MSQPDPDPVLQAKHRDYCSARIAEALLSLSPGDIFGLAEAEARAMGRSAPESYLDAVRLATGRVRDRLKLPEFEEWAAEYERNPQAFNDRLMGLWESDGAAVRASATKDRDG